jgi:hypothetical protein
MNGENTSPRRFCKSGIQGFPDKHFGNPPSPHNFSDPFGEDKFDFAAPDFFVEPHDREKFSALHGIQFDPGWQTGPLK